MGYVVCCHKYHFYLCLPWICVPTRRQCHSKQSNLPHEMVAYWSQIKSCDCCTQEEGLRWPHHNIKRNENNSTHCHVIDTHSAPHAHSGILALWCTHSARHTRSLSVVVHIR